MSPQHNIRSDRGKNKGKFTSIKKKQAREKLIAACKKKRAERKQLRLDLSQILKSGGNRVIDLETWLEDMWCNNCNSALSLKNFYDEQKHGVASIFTIFCDKCNTKHEVSTSKRVAGSKLFTNNCRAALGMVDSGLGEAEVNTFLSALNIPAISPSLLKRHERFIMPAVEEVAEKSFVEAIREEKALTIEKENETVADNNNNDLECVKLKATVDGAWFKRGNGFSYNSSEGIILQKFKLHKVLQIVKSSVGYASLCGHYSGKVMGVTTRSKSCRHCINGHSKDDHKCVHNWSGSSKAMEPDMIVELVVDNPNLQKENVEVGVIVGDNDTSTMAAINQKSKNKIEKWSDLNHTKKSLVKGLYDLKVTPSVRKYLTHLFSCAIKCNRGNPDAVKAAINNVIPHAYGEHQNCGEWCKAREVGVKFKHKWLPRGKPLCDSVLREKLNKLFSRYANNAVTIAPCGSTQKNEAFNSLATRKHPKSKCYSQSESHVLRVKAAAAQANKGTQYVLDVNKSLLISPGKETTKYRIAKDRKLQKQSVQSKLVETKKRRLFMKAKKTKETEKLTKKEGVTYETDCDLYVSPMLLDGISHISLFTYIYQHRSYNFDRQINILEILFSEYLSEVDCKEATIVYFDLETTDLSNTAEICQIAASCNGLIYDQYVMPKKPISKKASEITGLKCIHKNNKTELQLHNIPVPTLSAKDALVGFICFMKKQNQKIILAAHNCYRFDANIIIRQLKKYNLFDAFQSKVIGFTDTYSVFRRLLPGRVKAKNSFSIEALVQDFLGSNIDFKAHNAVNDINVLTQLISTIGCNHSSMMDSAMSVTEYIFSRPDVIKNIIVTLQPLGPSVSLTMQNKLAKAGFSMNILQEILQKHGESGIHMMLKESIRGKPRVTNSEKIISEIINKLKIINSTS